MSASHREEPGKMSENISDEWPPNGDWSAICDPDRNLTYAEIYCKGCKRFRDSCQCLSYESDEKTLLFNGWRITQRAPGLFKVISPTEPQSYFIAYAQKEDFESWAKEEIRCEELSEYFEFAPLTAQGFQDFIMLGCDATGWQCVSPDHVPVEIVMGLIADLFRREPR